MVDSTSWTVRPHFGVGHVEHHVPAFRHDVQLAEESRPERRPRTLGMSMALTQTTSVQASMAARPISGSPGAVSTTTYWNSSASCSKQPA